MKIKMGINMKPMAKILLIILFSLVIMTSSANAVSFSDADGDGICEPGEEITFIGDETYTSSDGEVHEFKNWYWDLDGDGDWDINAPIVTATFDIEGAHIVTVYQRNGDALFITLTVIVESEPVPVPEPMSDPEQILANAIDDLEDMKPTGDHKLDKTLDKAIKDLDKAMNEFEKDKPDKAFDKIAKAIQHLEKAQKKGGAATQEIIDDLIDLVEGIVDKAIEEAELACEDDKHIQKAHKHYDKALDELAKEKYHKAIKEFRRSYKDANKALKRK